MDSVNRGERLVERQIESSFVTRAHLRLRSRSNGQNFALFVLPVPSPNGSPEAKLDLRAVRASRGGASSEFLRDFMGRNAAAQAAEKDTEPLQKLAQPALGD